MSSFNSILGVFLREFKIHYRSFFNILSIFLFFILSIIIFVFAVGSNKELFNQIGVGIIWTIILLSNTLSIKKFFQNDFDDNSLIIIHMSGLSYEIIALIKMLTIWVFLQAPFFIILPIAFLLLEMQFDNLKIVYLSFLIGSVIITCISAISGSMNLLNKKNFSIGGLIIMILSIPVIIFGVNIVNVSNNIEIIRAQINILLGIMFFFLAISPWASGLCIRISLQNK